MCCCLSNTPYWGPVPQPKHVPWLGIKLVTLWFTGQHSIQWATPARAIGNCGVFIYYYYYYYYCCFIFTRCNCIFRFSDSSWFSSGICMFLGIYPFHPGCPVSWHIVVRIFSQSFVFLWCQLLSPLFHFWFYLCGSFLFFLDESGLPILFIF